MVLSNVIAEKFCGGTSLTRGPRKSLKCGTACSVSKYLPASEHYAASPETRVQVRFSEPPSSEYHQPWGTLICPGFMDLRINTLVATLPCSFSSWTPSLSLRHSQNTSAGCKKVSEGDRSQSSSTFRCLAWKNAFFLKPVNTGHWNSSLSDSQNYNEANV